MNCPTAVSSWSFHAQLGEPRYELDPQRDQVVVEEPAAAPTLDLLELPAACAAHDIDAVEICHFHLADIGPAYLAELRARLEAANVQLFQLLIDSGDLSSASSQQRASDVQLVRRWMEVAAQIGAAGARYVAGDNTPGQHSIAASGAAFRELAEYALRLGLRPATENWRVMSIQPDDLLRIIDASERDYGLVADFANAAASGDKLGTLARLLPRATSLHAWGDFDQAGLLDRDGFDRCLHLARDAGFAGTVTLLPRAAASVWGGIAELHRLLRAA